MIKPDADPFNVNEWCEKIIREVNETDEKFIFTTIKPFIDSITTMEISKKELIMAIQLIRKQKEAIEKYGVPISDNWDTAVQQNVALEKAYRAGFQDGIEEIREAVTNSGAYQMNQLITEYDKGSDDAFEIVLNILEQLKENKNE